MIINSENIKRFREKTGFSQTELSEIVGVSLRTIQNYESGGKIPKSKHAILRSVLENPAKHFSDDFNQSLNESTPEYKPEAIPVDFKEMNVMFVPLVSKFAYAGYLDNLGDHEYVGELPKIPFANDVQNKGDYLCFEVKGDSMESDGPDTILEGDILLCRNVRQEYWKSKLHINKWDFVIVHKERGVLIKRITKHDTNTHELTLHSLNDYYDDIVVHLQDVQAIFNVVDLRRKRNRR